MREYLRTGRVKYPEVLRQIAAEDPLAAMLMVPWNARPVLLTPTLQRDFWKRNKQISERIKAKKAG